MGIGWLYRRYLSSDDIKYETTAVA
jgi:hypothetical protein